MSLHSTSTRSSVLPPRQSGASPDLHGRWLVLARLGWVTLTLLALILFIASLPPYFAYLHRLNGSGVPDSQLGPIGQITPAGLRALQMMGLSLDFYAWYQIILRIVFLLVFIIIGGVLFWKTWRTSSNRVALLASFFLVLFPISFNHVLLSLLPPAWTLLGKSVFFLGSICWGLFFFLFPAGQFVPRWTRWLVVGWITYWAFDAIVFPDAQNTIYNLILFVLFLAEVGSLVWIQVYHYRHVSTQAERQQSKWVVFGAAIGFGSYLIGSVILVGLLAEFSSHLSPLYYLSGLIGYTLLNVLLCLFPLFLAIAILRYRLWDIDIIINRTLVYGTLTASIIGLYVLVVVSLGTLLRAQGNLLISLLATGLIAVLFQPLRLRLQRAVNRLMFGERDNPYQVISRLGQRLETTLVPEAVLPMIVETVTQALKLPYAAITLKQGDEFIIVASNGTEPGYISGNVGAGLAPALLTLPLVYQAETIGQLLLAPRAKGESFTPADRRLLDDLARQAGIAAHAVRLTTELQRARERLVTTREEERRRLRRDLHDGLGPTLAALNLQAGAVRALIPQDPAQASALVTEWRTTLRAVIADIRRLVYALRPPALDELGLVGALREQAAQYSTHSGTNGVQMALQAPDHLPQLPAAVEVAAYRIAQEALANVVHHAQARTCRLRLWPDDALHLEITDDGIGLPEEHRAGVGLLSMRERAEELGGSCIIEPAVPSGTRVSARLPLPEDFLTDHLSETHSLPSDDAQRSRDSGVSDGLSRSRESGVGDLHTKE